MNDEANTTEVQADVPASSSITIQGLSFDAPHKYSEGHVLTLSEARQLQQTFKEALRNNFAAVIKKTLKEANLEETSGLSDDTKAALQTAFADYASTFEFAARSGTPRAPVDPIEREFQKLVKPILEKALEKKGIDWKQASDEQKVGLFAMAKERRPDVWKMAEERVAATKSLAAEALDL